MGSDDDSKHVREKVWALGAWKVLAQLHWVEEDKFQVGEGQTYKLAELCIPMRLVLVHRQDTFRTYAASVPLVSRGTSL